MFTLLFQPSPTSMSHVTPVQYMLKAYPCINKFFSNKTFFNKIPKIADYCIFATNQTEHPPDCYT